MKKPICPNCNCGEGYVFKEKGKWFCLECYNYIKPVEYNSIEHEVCVNKMVHRYLINRIEKLEEDMKRLQPQIVYGRVSENVVPGVLIPNKTGVLKKRRKNG